MKKQITFATYEVDVDSSTVEFVKQIEPNFFRYQPKELIKTLFSSAKKFHPNCRTVVLSNENTEFSDLSNDTEVVRYNLNTHHLTLSRTQAQVNFLKQSKGNSHLVFLDSDMLIQSNLENLFDQPFDIALTLRQHDMPINGGLIIVNAFGYQAACHFMDKVLSLMQNNYKNFQAWYGSQYALKQIVIDSQSEVKENGIVIRDNVRVLLLPSLLYNYTAPVINMDGPYPDKKILHFKGTRKKCQIPYYKKFFA